MVVFQPASLHSAASSEYLVFFRSIPSSHGTVSSMRSAVFTLVDHTTMSGRRDVVVISLGNWSCLPRSTRMLHSWSEQKSFGVCFGLVLLLPPPSLTKLMWCSVGGRHPLLSRLHPSSTSASFVRTWSWRNL